MTSIQALLAEGQSILSESSDSPLLDCQLLLCHVLDKSITYLMTWPEQTLSDEQVAQYQALFSRRVNGEPIAYIVGERDFWSLTLKVAPSTLIPRPDTETLVELVLAHFQSEELKCLDLGTGTGAIALALASEQPSWHIEAVDFNESAVKLAKQNAQLNQLERVNIYQSDWFSNVSAEKSFDVIVSNPPYIDENDEHLGQGDVRFEPLTALVADNNGFADIEHIAAEAKRFLKNNGRVYFEHGYQQGEQVRHILSNMGYSTCHTEQDLAGNDRITWAILTNHC